MPKLPNIKYIRRTNAKNDAEFVFIGYVKYVDPKTGKAIEIFDGDISDGATGAFDIHSLAWWVHDKICKESTWSDGTPIGSWTAARVLSDILRQEGRWARAIYWRSTTYLFGCHNVRKNGWWK